MTPTVIPQFRITNARRSSAFYVDGLGFAIDWEHWFEPGFPVFMQVTRAGQSIFLSQQDKLSPTDPTKLVYANALGDRLVFVLRQVQEAVEDFREQAPINTFVNTLFSAF